MAKSFINEALEEGDLKVRLKDHLNYITNILRPKRNKIIHGIWGPTASANKVALLETTARGEVKFRVGEEMSAHDFLEIAAEIDEAHFHLTQLTYEASKLLGRVQTVNVGQS